MTIHGAMDRRGFLGAVAGLVAITPCAGFVGGAGDGLALAIVQSQPKRGQIVLKASANNLPSASVVINTR